MHNTHNGELPGHVRFGEGHEPGKDPWAAARAKEAAEAAEKEKQKKLADSSTDVQVDEDYSGDLSFNYNDAE